jgi:hypothetical protein
MENRELYYAISKKWSNFTLAWWTWKETRERIVERFIYSERISKEEFEKHYNLTINNE